MKEELGVDISRTETDIGGMSRRNALKVGVAVGVGAAVWSGPTITSLGGTPAYATGCTFAVNVRISGGDRNTDQSAGCVNQDGPGTGFGYHAVGTLGNLPTGYTMVPSGWNSQVCSTSTNPYTLTMTYPSSLNCAIDVVLFKPSDGVENPIHTFTFSVSNVVPGDPTQKTLVWRLPTGVDTAATGKNFPSQTRYAIFLRCVSPGLEWCFD